MTEPNLILIHGLFGSRETILSGGISRACANRSKAVADHGEAVGVRHYECIESSKKLIANRFLRMVRGTSRPVDAVELISLDEELLRVSLAKDSTRNYWQTMLNCTQYGFDPKRSFLLMGNERQLVSGPGIGQRVLWFGHGISQLSEAEFVAHYTGHHGPLVAENAESLGVRRYRQVASERSDLCESLCELGLGRAVPPPVFAELVMSKPALNIAALRARRLATRKITADEKRHIDFHRSMLLLA
jgi:hypothetical protein